MSGLATRDQLINVKGARVWLLCKRALTAFVILGATICFLANAAGLVGVWIIRRPVCDRVTTLSTFVNEKLGRVEQALTRVSARAEEGKQSLTLINSVAGKLGDRLEESQPLTALIVATRENLLPRITELRAQATALHDSVVSVNSALETLDSLGLINLPTFTDELSVVSERIDTLEDNVQALRSAIDEAKARAPADLVAAIATRTTKIDNVMAQVQSAAVKYQATVAEKRQQVSDLAHRLLAVINLLVLLLSALFLAVGAGQLLLIYVCWQYVRRGRFPLLGPQNVMLT